MKLEALLLIIERKNPQLTGETVTMPVSGFRKALTLAYNEGLKEGDSRRSGGDLIREFRSIFGGSPL